MSIAQIVCVRDSECTICLLLLLLLLLLFDCVAVMLSQAKYQLQSFYFNFIRSDSKVRAVSIF